MCIRDRNKAAELKYGKLPELQKQLEAEEKLANEKKEDSLLRDRCLLYTSLELTGTHPAEQVQILLRGAVTPRRGATGLAGIGTTVLAHLVTGQVVHVGLARCE